MLKSLCKDLMIVAFKYHVALVESWNSIPSLDKFRSLRQDLPMKFPETLDASYRVIKCLSTITHKTLKLQHALIFLLYSRAWKGKEAVTLEIFYRNTNYCKRCAIWKKQRLYSQTSLKLSSVRVEFLLLVFTVPTQTNTFEYSQNYI